MFYSYFDYLCKRKGITKNKACQEMGVSRSVAAKWKSTQTNPSMATLQKIADYFEVSLDELISQSEIKENPATVSDGQEDQYKAFKKILDELDDENVESLREYAIFLKQRQKSQGNH